MLQAIDNSGKIAKESFQKRVKAKEQHARQVQRDKEALAKDKERKEKRKRATQKKEKRRGFGWVNRITNTKPNMPIA